MARKPKALMEPQAKLDPKAPVSIESRVAELEGDLLRLAQLCGQVWGEPIASAALDIAKKRQGVA